MFVRSLAKKFHTTAALVAVLVIAGITQTLSSPATALDPSQVASTFNRLVNHSVLDDASIVLVDESDNQIVYERNASSLRKPASVLKLFSATAAYTYLDPAQVFPTTVSVGTTPKSIVIQGSLDPWFANDNTVATKMGRTSLPRIEYNSLSALKTNNAGSIKHSTIYYSNLYVQDVAALSSFYRKHGVVPTFKRVSDAEASSLAGTELFTSQSPTLREILDWTLTWSDNLLAERIARLASAAAGNSADDAGVSKTFKALLSGFGIDGSNIVVKDASGLSRDNRVSAHQIAQLLLRIKSDKKFEPLLGGLPVGGISGTLRKRFIETAPDAVGLVRAKTGTLNGTANLAGYVEAGDREYAFVIIADRLSKSGASSKSARDLVDRILGKLAAPTIKGTDIFGALNGESETALVQSFN